MVNLLTFFKSSLASLPSVSRIALTLLCRLFGRCKAGFGSGFSSFGNGFGSGFGSGAVDGVCSFWLDNFVVFRVPGVISGEIGKAIAQLVLVVEDILKRGLRLSRRDALRPNLFLSIQPGPPIRVA